MQRKSHSPCFFMTLIQLFLAALRKKANMRRKSRKRPNKLTASYLHPISSDVCLHDIQNPYMVPSLYWVFLPCSVTPRYPIQHFVAVISITVVFSLRSLTFGCS